MANSFLNESQIKENWLPLIVEAVGEEDANRMASWLPIYAHNHALSESANATVGSVPGMGAVALPEVPGSQYDFGTAKKGSGDKPVSYLTMALQIAADTVGLNVVPVVPADSPLTILTYADFIYADGKLDSKAQKPKIFKADVTLKPTVKVGAIVTFGDDLTTVYLGKSRLQGYPIFMVKKSNDAKTLNEILDAATAIKANDGAETDATLNDQDKTAKYVRALEDHISGYSGVLFTKLMAAADGAESVEAMKFAAMPYNREEGESNNSLDLGMKFYSKSVQAETWQVSIATTREQIDDARQFGFDIAGKAQKALINEASQSLNKNILERIFALGAKNHKNIFESTGEHYNVNFDNAAGTQATDFVLGWDADGNLTTIKTDQPVPMAKATTGGETLITAQRRILDQILAAGNMVGVRGRREPADTIVTNATVGTLLQTIQGFSLAPVQNNLKKTVGLRMLGSIAGMNVYVDPNMNPADTRVAVFRKGDGESPGLIYMPYRIADIVSTIAEDTMAPKFQLKSRGKLVEAGHNPEVFYMVIKINVSGAGLLR